MGAGDARRGRSLALRDRLLAVVAPILLLVVASIAVVRFHSLDQTSWRGGGFGMFATYDTVRSRSIVIEIEASGRRDRVAVPPDMQRLGERAIVTPGGAALPELAERIATRSGAEVVRARVSGFGVQPSGDHLVIRSVVIREVVVR